MNQSETLEKLFHHDKLARQFEAELLDADKAQLSKTLDAATRSALEKGDEESEGRLVVIAGLWAHAANKSAADALARLLRHDSTDVRQAAAESLGELADQKYELFANAARSILDEKAGTLAGVEELAFLLSEIEDEGTADILLSMLEHGSTRVVVAAIEVAGEWGLDERIAKSLKKLEDDRREVRLQDEEEGHVTLSVGELAAEVVSALTALGRGDGL